MLDADIRGFFDNIDHEWMLRFLQHRIADRRILRLIRKWLTAGVSEDGQWSRTTVGTPQGSVISPILANVFLHYVFDLWANQWRERHDCQTGACHAAEDQTAATSVHARCGSRSGPMAWVRGPWVVQLPCGPGQLQALERIPHRSPTTLAARPSQTKPEGATTVMGAGSPLNSKMASQPTYPTSLS